MLIQTCGVNVLVIYEVWDIKYSFYVGMSMSFGKYRNMHICFVHVLKVRLFATLGHGS